MKIEDEVAPSKSIYENSKRGILHSCSLVYS